MTAFTNILVDVDATVPAHPALERAVHLARRSGARLTIADVHTVPPEVRRVLGADAEQQLLEERRQKLEALAKGITDVPVEARLLSGRPATAVIQEVLRGGHDLLVRAHARDLIGRERPYGAVDMELVRQCPCPVLLVRPGAPPAHPLVVGAVRATTEDPAEHALNAKLVELTLRLAELQDGRAVLLQAWAPFAERLLRGHYSEEAFHAYVEDTRREAEQALERLRAQFGDRLPADRAVSRRGEPEDVILDYTLGEAADLVVIGTVARSGVAGLLIGNTAERVLRKLPCSVLTVKPDGFVSPVRLDA